MREANAYRKAGSGLGMRPGETWAEYLKRLIPEGKGCKGCPFQHEGQCANWGEPVGKEKNRWCAAMVEVEK